MTEKNAPLTPAERQRRSRAERAKVGGRLVQVMLTAEAAAKLDKLTAGGDSASDVVNRLLIRTRP